MSRLKEEKIKHIIERIEKEEPGPDASEFWRGHWNGYLVALRRVIGMEPDLVDPDEMFD